MAKPIIKIRRYQPDIAVRIVEAGCGNQITDAEQLRLVIRPPECPGVKNSPLQFCGCWPGYDVAKECPKIEEYPSLIYDGFELSDDGEIIFRFDSKFWLYPSGRYWATIEVKADGTQLVCFDIDLETVVYHIDRVTSEQGKCK